MASTASCELLCLTASHHRAFPPSWLFCRQEEAETKARLFEVPLSKQIKDLHDDLHDIGFAQSDAVDDELIAEPVWDDPLIAAVPARLPLLAYRQVPLNEVLRHPLALGDTNPCEDHARQVERILRRVDQEQLRPNAPPIKLIGRNGQIQGNSERLGISAPRREQVTAAA